jgi:hypothetical protein
MKEQRDGNAQKGEIQAARKKVQSACKKTAEQVGEIRRQKTREESGEGRSKKAAGQIGKRRRVLAAVGIAMGPSGQGA